MMMEGTYANYSLIFRAMTGKEFPNYRSFIYQSGFRRPLTIEYAPMANRVPDDFDKRVAAAKTLIVVVIEGDTFTPVKMTGADWPDFVAKMGWQ